jgi:hypothetical protein
MDEVSGRAARCFFIQHTQTGKNIPNDPKRPQNLLNGPTIDRMTICTIYQHLLCIERPSKIYQNWDFGLKICHLTTLVSRTIQFFSLSQKATTLCPGGIQSHDPQLQSPRWQELMMPLATM